MAARIRLSPSQVVRFEKAVVRLESLGALARPLCVAQLFRQGAAHYYLLRRPDVIDQLRAAGNEVERDGIVAALAAKGSLAWFNVSWVIRKVHAPVRLFAVREEGRHHDLVELEPKRPSPTRKKPSRKRRRLA
jgi:hypothetical protein